MFEETNTCIEINIPDADICVYPELFSAQEADVLFDTLKNEIAWRQDKIKLYGKEHDVPRLTAWYGDADKSYAYSGITLQPIPWTPALLQIKKKIESVSDIKFNSVLLNLYRSGADSVSWHSDDEPELGENPVIGSVTLGQARPFQMKHKFIKGEKRSIILEHGSYLLMKGRTQHQWLHQIPKSKKLMDERINLTYRVVR